MQPFANMLAYRRPPVNHDEAVGVCLKLFRRDRGSYSEPRAEPVPLPPDTPVRLKVRVEYTRIRFFYALDGEWRAVGPDFEAAGFSDEHGGLAFTGTFLGVCAQDVGGEGLYADFGSFG